MNITGLSGGYGGPPIIESMDLHIKQGEFFGLLGPNGSGKTTLFKLVSGSLKPDHGDVSLQGASLLTMSPVQRARKIAVLTQETNVSFDFTVEEVIRLGRYAFQKGLFKMLSREDRALIDEIMALTDTEKFRDTSFFRLSGGEKQRVLLAKALVQEPEVLLLDEPTNHLDIRHTFDMLNVLKERQETQGLTVFAILHDLNIAALYCDRVGLLHEGKLQETGPVDIMRRSERLSSIYGVETWTQSHPTLPRPQLLMNPKKQDESAMSLHDSVTVEADRNLVQISSPKPLRTISNGVAGEGIQWIRHIANFHVDKQYSSRTPEADMKAWLEKRSLPVEQSIGLMTAVKTEMAVVRKETINGIAFTAVVTAGTGNAVDITYDGPELEREKIGTINTFLAVDANLTDGALVNACMSAVEAKVQALRDEDVRDPQTGTPATSTSTDALVIAATQQGKRTPYAGSGTPVGRGIGRIVYEATREAVRADRRWKETHT
ncbi:adenosylcobinamide amidohydrolase [Bacillus daqingensis]|uniref:Adenosylcobinamide amidohydrolase n=1 Tax=Bacillus daqingensis TaxID=872396 RepID=A0ABV9NRW7_9BACI